MGLSRYPALAKDHSLSMISGASGAEEKKLGTRPKRLATSRWNSLCLSGAEGIERSKGLVSMGHPCGAGKCASAKASATCLKAVAECPGCRSIPSGVQQA